MQIAICDDERLFRKELRTLLVEYKQEKRIHLDIYEFENGEALLSSKSIFDIVFLDYQMPGIDGMESARILRTHNSICSIIFITAYPEFVLESFEVQPFRFIIKPMKPDKIKEALDNYIKQQKLLYPLTIIEDGEQKTIHSQDIVYLEGDGKYCYVRTNKEIIHSSKTLAQVYNLLPQHCFYRIHKSYVINMYFISSVKGNTVTFTNGEMAIIGRNHIAEFKKVYMSFIKKLLCEDVIMFILFVAESIMYYISLLIISIKIFEGNLNVSKLLVSFFIYIPTILLGIKIPNETFVIVNLIIHILQLLCCKFVIANVKLKSITYSFLLLFGTNILINSVILAFVPVSSFAELLIEVAVHIIMLIVSFIICSTKLRLYVKRIIDLTSKSIKTIIILLVWSSNILIALMFDIKNISQNELMTRITFQLLIIFVALVCVTFPILVLNSTTNTYLKNLTANYENQLAAQAEHYSALSKANFELRRFRHDLNNIKIGVIQLINEGKHTEAISMLDSANTDIYNTTNSLLNFDTGNGIVDALLADKQQKAASSNIKIVFEGAVATESITATELCVIFGNTIDNAIEACKKIDVEVEKIINIICKCNSGFMFLNMSNPVKEPVTIKNNIPATTKEEKSLHGFGLYSLDKVIKKHHGELNLSCSDCIFCLDLSVCL